MCPPGPSALSSCYALNGEAGLRKFILLWCNSLFLENNVISTNDIALNWVEGVSRFVLDWENRIEL